MCRNASSNTYPKMELPRPFVDQMVSQLGADEAAALCRALDSEQPVSLRLHPDRKATFVARWPLGEAVAWNSEGYYLTERPSFTFDPAFHAGAYYVQEASSQFVERLLPDDVKGCRLLDLCAAPGGKTTLYSSKVGPEGLVVANEIDRKRALTLVDNVRKWGVGNVAVTSTDADHLSQLEEWFDVVAVDAPCSGEGMFRKDEGARTEWSEQHVSLCAMRQDEILEAAWRALRPGGRLIYSTCTFNRNEDEGSIERLLAKIGDEAVEAPAVSVEESWGVVTARVGVAQTFRFMPHKARGEGFFAAVLCKSEEADKGRLPRPKRKVVTPVDKQTRAELARWVKHPEQLRFVVAGELCYGWPEAQAEAMKLLSELLPVIYSGVAMGQLFKGKLKPEQALAHYVGLERGVVAQAELPYDEAIRYLRREEPAVGFFGDGINLVCHGGLALGFAKRIGARINNMYPNALRILKQA